MSIDSIFSNISSGFQVLYSLLFEQPPEYAYHKTNNVKTRKSDTSNNKQNKATQHTTQQAATHTTKPDSTVTYSATEQTEAQQLAEQAEQIEQTEAKQLAEQAEQIEQAEAKQLAEQAEQIEQVGAERMEQTEQHKNINQDWVKISLNSILTIADVEELHNQLKQYLGKRVQLSGKNVQRIDTASLQLLSAFMLKADVTVCWVDYSPNLCESARLLGISTPLGLPTEIHG